MIFFYERSQSCFVYKGFLFISWADSLVTVLLSDCSMFPHFSICTVNARGLRNDVKRKAIFLYAKSLNTDFCFIQESHANLNDFKFWKSQWGDELFSSFGSNFSAGVLT